VEEATLRIKEVSKGMFQVFASGNTKMLAEAIFVSFLYNPQLAIAFFNVLFPNFKASVEKTGRVVCLEEDLRVKKILNMLAADAELGHHLFCGIFRTIAGACLAEQLPENKTVH